MFVGKILHETLVISKQVVPARVRYMMIGRRKDDKGEIFSFSLGDGAAEEPFKNEDPHSQNHKCEKTSGSLELTKEELNEFIERLKELKEANK